MKTRFSLKTGLLGGLAAVIATAAGPAWADCDANGDLIPGTDVCYRIRGSDTLFDIMKEAIRQARLDTSVPGLAAAAADLHYLGTGSGNGETALRTALATPAPNGSLGSQSIAPMSRNFRPNVIDPLSTTFVDRSPTALTAAGHAAWAPTSRNVPGLDAAVFVVKSTAALENLTFATFVDNAIPESAFAKGVVNNGALPTAFGNGGAWDKLAPTINYNSVMSVILSGVDGSGTLAACADPRRVQAVQDMSLFLGVTTIQHVIRRDENSGTTDTFKDRIMVVPSTADTARYPFTGGRFCNGLATGGITGATLQQGICSANRDAVCTTDAQCDLLTPNSKCWFNLNNQDYDPIRRPCMPADATSAPTSCTDLTTGLRCQASDGNPNCTQGLVVALSDTDPGSTDITTSIGARVGNSGGDVIGYAGREAASTALGTKSLAINTHRPTDAKVRNSEYMLARRLFIQNSFENSVDVLDIPTNNAGGGGGNGGADQLTKEQLLWTGFLTDRARMDPIVRQFNFIRCSGIADGGDPDAEANNLCSQTPAAATPSAFGAIQPTGALAGANGGTPSIDFRGRVPTVFQTGVRTTGNMNGRLCTVATPCTCSATTPCQDAPLIQRTVAANTLCVSGSSGAGTVCPDAPLRPSNAPCSVNAECTSGVCADTLSHGVPGELHGLYCQ